MSAGWAKLAAILLIVAASALSGCSPPVPPAHEAYVWQRRWSAELLGALRETPPVISRWHVLAGEAERGHVLTEVAVDFAALRETQRPVVAVVRIDGSLDDPRERAILDAVENLLRHWQAQGVLPSGIEIDHDASLSQLPRYADFLGGLRQRLDHHAASGRIGLSATLLPAWIDAPDDLVRLVKVIDEPVLQLHAQNGRARRLFDADEALSSLTRFAPLAPQGFLVALPNYGSRVSRDEHGMVTSVVSEGGRTTAIGEQESEELFVRPAEMARFLGRLRQHGFAGLKGIVWFRLPLPGDQRSWSQSTWLAVVRGEALTEELSLATRQKTGEAEKTVLLRNAAPIDAEYPAEVRFPADCASVSASGDYLAEAQNESVVLLRARKGLLRSGRELEIGATRCPAEVIDRARIVR